MWESAMEVRKSSGNKLGWAAISRGCKRACVTGTLMYNRWVLYYRNSNSSGKLDLRARDSDSGTPSVRDLTKFVSLARGAHRELGGTFAPQELCAWWWCQRWGPLWSNSLPGTPSSNLNTEFLSVQILPLCLTAPGHVIICDRPYSLSAPRTGFIWTALLGLDLSSILFPKESCVSVYVIHEPFFFNSGLWGYWHCGHSWPIVPASGDSEDDCGEADGM
jgi:hypothetical protein